MIWSSLSRQWKTFRVLNSSFFPWVTSALFLACCYFFYQNVLLLFLLNTDLLFYIIISRKRSHLKFSLTCFNNPTNLIVKKIKKYSMTETQNITLKIYMSSVFQFIIYLYCKIYSSYILHKRLNKIIKKPDWLFVSFWNLKSLYLTCSYTFSFVVPPAVIRFFSLSLVVTRCHLLSLAVTRCYSLSLVTICCTIRCYSLLLFVIHCHSLYQSLSLVVIQYTTRLSSYKRYFSRRFSIQFTFSTVKKSQVFTSLYC